MQYLLLLALIPIFIVSGAFARNDGFLPPSNKQSIATRVDGFLPPRVHQICYNSYIGVEYNPRLEKRCRVLWTEWTQEIKMSMGNKK